jgi:branched-chain amino acid transport system ATP-binding protein
MLSVERLRVEIGHATVLRHVDLTVPAGTLCGVIGRNGAGKTTLLRSIMGLLPTHSGQVRLAGEALGAVPAHRRAHLGLGYMPEDRRLVPSFSAQENILLPVWAMGLADWDARLDWVYALMPEVRVLAGRQAAQLSGGQGKLVALARALMIGSRLLLLDEPFEGLAPALARRLAEVLGRVRGEGLTILLAESNQVHVAHLLDAVHVIERGAIEPA